MTVLPVAPATVKLELPTSKSVVTVKSLEIVTSFGKPTCNVTSVPDLVTAVFTSFVVPMIFRSSVSRSTSSVATPSESIVRAVATATVPAAVNLPCASTLTSDEIVFDPFANAHAVIQTYLNLPVSSNGPTEQGLEIDEDLVIKNISDVSVLLTDNKFLDTIGEITTPKFFENDANKWIISEILEYHNEYRKPPTLDVFKSQLSKMDNDVLKCHVQTQY